MEDNKEASFRFCQQCGHKCNIESLFCSKCGTRLEELEIKEEQNAQENIQDDVKEEVKKEEQSTSKDTKQCPFCGQTIKAVAKKCRFCGKWFEKRDNNHIRTIINNLYSYFKDIKTEKWIMYVISIVLVIVVIMLTTSVVKPQKAPNCESAEAKKQLLELFKQNSWAYNWVDPSTVQKIEIEMPMATSYNKDIDQYYCQAKIKMYSTSEGFECKNKYNAIKYNKDTKYQSDWIRYSVQLSEGKPLVLYYGSFTGQFQE